MNNVDENEQIIQSFFRGKEKESENRCAKFWEIFKAHLTHGRWFSMSFFSHLI